MSDEVIRDWQPGDGIRCRYFKRAPLNFPCGVPVKTKVQTYTLPGGRRGTRTDPLCENHKDVGRAVPSQMAAAADKAARERLIATHYEEYQRFLVEESERIRAARIGGAA